MWFRPTQDWRILAIGDQGAAELDKSHGMLNPKAVYPVWEFGQQSLEELEGMMAVNVGDTRIRRVATTPADEIPVRGQEHRVVVIRVPNLSTKFGQQFMTTLSQMQRDYPDCIVHVHGVYSYKWVFGSYRAADMDCRTEASKGYVRLPNGRRIVVENAPAERKWVNLLGFTPGELKVPRIRCMFNIKSAQWAAKHWNDFDEFPSTIGEVEEDDLKAIFNGKKPKPTNSSPPRKHRRGEPQEGDKFFCDRCSFAPTCRSYRIGSICSVPDAESSDLARHFKTRNSHEIIEGLGKIIEGEVARYAEGREAEREHEEIDAKVTKIADGLFAKGVALAKLVDPSLRTAAVAVQVNSGGATSVGVGNATPAALAASAVAALEAGGIPRHKITAEMVEQCVQSPSSIEGIIAAEAAKYTLPAGLIIEADEIK